MAMSVISRRPTGRSVWPAGEQAEGPVRGLPGGRRTGPDAFFSRLDRHDGVFALFFDIEDGEGLFGFGIRVGFAVETKV